MWTTDVDVRDKQSSQWTGYVYGYAISGRGYKKFPHSETNNYRLHWHFSQKVMVAYVETASLYYKILDIEQCYSDQWLRQSLGGQWD